MADLIEIEDLEMHYPVRSGFFNRVTDHVLAVDGVTFTIKAGETYGLIGESGSGKSTIGKMIVGLETPTSGHIKFQGVDVTTPKNRKNLSYNKDVQMIFQDSFSSLNPRKTIFDIISEPLRNFSGYSKEVIVEKVKDLLAIVGLPERTMYQYPYQFSGGQRQRIGIARAVATQPKLIIADEPVSALDLSVQAQVLNYMKRIQKEYGIAFLFISHDLGVVRHMTENLAIMHNGRFVEIGTREDIFDNPQHIYTKRLLAAIPEMRITDRDARRAQRRELEIEFEQQKSIFYDDKNRPLPLVRLSETHLAAIPQADAEKGAN
jgi:peptide/nickel transport system ATP-binding protein